MSDNTIKTAGDEIDLLSLAKVIWNKRKKILYITFCFLVLGFAYALLSPNEFTANTTFLPKTTESSNGAAASLGGLASLAGINLPPIGGGAEIPPALYPKFASSVQFKRALISVPINVEGVQEKSTYAKYFEEVYQPTLLSKIQKYTIGLPGLLIRKFKNSPEKEGQIDEEIGLIGLTKNEVIHFDRIDSQLKVNTENKDGLVTITFSMPEPLMAAQMAKFALELLQKEVIAYKISNAQEQLRFSEERLNEKKGEFEESQKKLANFRDRNQNIVTASILNQLQQLEAEQTFSFTIYTELAKQVEQSKLQVAKDTPVFSIIQPVTIPTQKSSPRRPLILVIFSVFGFISGMGYVLLSDFLSRIKDQWNKYD